MYPEFQYLDAEILGISMDNISETSTLAETLGVKYKLLSDPNGKVVKEYGVYNLLGDGLAAPAVFIIGPDRGIEWSHVGSNIGDRPSAGEIIAHLK
ncbi:redoxin domain-containing protein [Dehalococcoidia bacterium]|nr:redoxin domain-containing protein [Dehalococcoidia bacterium]